MKVDTNIPLAAVLDMSSEEGVIIRFIPDPDRDGEGVLECDRDVMRIRLVDLIKDYAVFMSENSGADEVRHALDRVFNQLAEDLKKCAP